MLSVLWWFPLPSITRLLGALWQVLTVPALITFSHSGHHCRTLTFSASLVKDVCPVEPVGIAEGQAVPRLAYNVHEELFKEVGRRDFPNGHLQGDNQALINTSRVFLM